MKLYKLTIKQEGRGHFELLSIEQILAPGKAKLSHFH
jgi:hypothetical protein